MADTQAITAICLAAAGGNSCCQWAPEPGCHNRQQPGVTPAHTGGTSAHQRHTQHCSDDCVGGRHWHGQPGCQQHEDCPRDEGARHACSSSSNTHPNTQPFVTESLRVLNWLQRAAACRVQAHIPSIKTGILLCAPPQSQQAALSILDICRMIVSDTPAPRVTAPLSSQTAAITTARFSVSAPLPMDVPKLQSRLHLKLNVYAGQRCRRRALSRKQEGSCTLYFGLGVLAYDTYLFATSFAPMPKANMAQVQSAR
ncbi:hypothetical protein MMC29_000028 [Sticta canariensis]|nr:hypothetical protein [Sticta canariensis]